MNILNISPVFPPLWHYGGSVATSFAMAWELAAQGHELFAMTTEARYRSDQQVPISQDTEWDGVPVRYCKNKLYCGAAKIIVSQEDEIAECEAVGIDRHKIIIMGNGINLADLAGKQRRRYSL